MKRKIDKEENPGEIRSQVARKGLLFLNRLEGRPSEGERSRGVKPGQRRIEHQSLEGMVLGL